jgi:hypothetical protein
MTRQQWSLDVNADHFTNRLRPGESGVTEGLHVACMVAAVIGRAESKLSNAIQTDAANTRIHN